MSRGDHSLAFSTHWLIFLISSKDDPPASIDLMQRALAASSLQGIAMDSSMADLGHQLLCDAAPLWPPLCIQEPNKSCTCLPLFPCCSLGHLHLRMVSVTSTNQVFLCVCWNLNEKIQIPGCLTSKCGGKKLLGWCSGINVALERKSRWAMREQILFKWHWR